MHFRESMFDRIPQVLGAAYTYGPSRAMRRRLSHLKGSYHSSQDRGFSYFFKGKPKSFARHNGKLRLREDLSFGGVVSHWPEPELAVVLGRNHSPIAATLAVDFTAISIEVLGRNERFDGTFGGKTWYGSGSLGPSFVDCSRFEELENLDILLEVERNGHTILSQSYNTSRSLRRFSAIPDLIVEKFFSFNGDAPPSKRIQIDSDGKLPKFTTIMLGTGIVFREDFQSLRGDTVRISCSSIGSLCNVID